MCSFVFSFITFWLQVFSWMECVICCWRVKVKHLLYYAFTILEYISDWLPWYRLGLDLVSDPKQVFLKNKLEWSPIIWKHQFSKRFPGIKKIQQLFIKDTQFYLQNLVLEGNTKLSKRTLQHPFILEHIRDLMLNSFLNLGWKIQVLFYNFSIIETHDDKKLTGALMRSRFLPMICSLFPERRKERINKIGTFFHDENTASVCLVCRDHGEVLVY